MIMLIIFGFLFLIGFAFLIALMGTSFLKKHAVRMPDRTRSGMYQGVDVSGMAQRPAARPQAKPAAQDFRGEYQAGYEGSVPQQGPGRGAAPAPSMLPQMFPARTSAGGGKWAFILPVVVVAVVLVLLFGLREFVGSDVRPRMFFCESVDFTRLKPVHRSDTFTRGNLTIFVKSKTPLLLDKVYVEVYRLNTGEFEPYMDNELRLKPEWASFSMKALFDTVGSYMVSVYGKDNVLIAQKNVNIVPDSFAYRPLR